MKKNNSPYGWPFLKHRQVWIDKADKFYMVAESAGDSAHSSEPGSPLAFRKWRKAARYYERAAEYYRKAGLGWFAKSGYRNAAECWQEAGDTSEALRCVEHHEGIETYWEDD